MDADAGPVTSESGWHHRTVSLWHRMPLWEGTYFSHYILHKDIEGLARDNWWVSYRRRNRTRVSWPSIYSISYSPRPPPSAEGVGKGLAMPASGLAEQGLGTLCVNLHFSAKPTGRKNSVLPHSSKSGCDYRLQKGWTLDVSDFPHRQK